MGKVSTPFILCSIQTSPAKATLRVPLTETKFPPGPLIPRPARCPLRPQRGRGGPPGEDTRGPAASSIHQALPPQTVPGSLHSGSSGFSPWASVLFLQTLCRQLWALRGTPRLPSDWGTSLCTRNTGVPAGTGLALLRDTGPLKLETETPRGQGRDRVRVGVFCGQVFRWGRDSGKRLIKSAHIFGREPVSATKASELCSHSKSPFVLSRSQTQNILFVCFLTQRPTTVGKPCFSCCPLKDSKITLFMQEHRAGHLGPQGRGGSFEKGRDPQIPEFTHKPGLPWDLAL